jgi:polar amino acid transport system substrate-binding protein
VATKDVWDVAFLAGDPERAREISFTAPYVVINGTFAVRKDSPFNTPDQVDREGVRISVSGQSIYDLFLTRTLKHAKIVRAGNPREAAAMFQSERLEVCAGVQTAMLQLIASDPTLRMIPSRSCRSIRRWERRQGERRQPISRLRRKHQVGRIRGESIGAQRPGRCAVAPPA